MQLVKEYNLAPKKSLGQNFLLDQNLTDKIAKSAGQIEGEEILEIGPGPGGLTRSILARKPKKLIVIEKDERFFPLLSHLKDYFKIDMEIIIGDANNLTIKELNLNKPKIIANLPYNISTNLLFNWIEEIDNIKDLTLLFQKEVAERICASPDNKDYGKLSVIVQALMEAKILFNISPKAFTPPPKIDSSLIHLKPHSILLDKKITKNLNIVTTKLFAMRRKMINKAIKSLDLPYMEQLDLNLRAENLSVETYITLAKLMKDNINV